jgi:hypothetical protein
MTENLFRHVCLSQCYALLELHKACTRLAKCYETRIIAIIGLSEDRESRKEESMKKRVENRESRRRRAKERESKQKREQKIEAKKRGESREENGAEEMRAAGGQRKSKKRAKRGQRKECLNDRMLCALFRLVTADTRDTRYTGREGGGGGEGEGR